MRQPPGAKWLLWAAVLGTAATRAELAGARTEGTTGYSKAQTYSTALRYLRVDLGYEITEKDADAAYLLFRLVVPGHRDPSHGSIEIVENTSQVKVIIQLAQLPSYYESVLYDGLLRKLEEEYGDPVGKTRDKTRGKPREQTHHTVEHHDH